MASKTRTERRQDALSKERVVEAAIEILDEDGEAALTFRSLATRLATGSGAIYWHVTDKDDLLAAATDDVIVRVMSGMRKGAKPQDGIRLLALGLFDAIEAHPWVGGHLSRNPWQYAVLRILEGIGGQVEALGVPTHAQFHAVSALMSFILGLAAQYSASARQFTSETDRTEFLQGVADRRAQFDTAEHPFVRRIATQLPRHDERKQFLAGIDLILIGIENTR